MRCHGMYHVYHTRRLPRKLHAIVAEILIIEFWATIAVDLYILAWSGKLKIYARQV